MNSVTLEIHTEMHANFLCGYFSRGHCDKIYSRSAICIVVKDLLSAGPVGFPVITRFPLCTRKISYDGKLAPAWRKCVSNSG